MKINTSQTRAVACDKKGQVKIRISLANELLEQVDSFIYLGRKITSDGQSKVEVRSRIDQARRRGCYFPKVTVLKLGTYFLNTMYGV